MKRNKGWFKVEGVRILWAVLAVVMCTVSYGWAEDINITEDVLVDLIVESDTTVNLSANVLGPIGITVKPDSYLNIYSGNVTGFFGIQVLNPLPGETAPVVTVHGTDFGGDGDFSVPGQVSFSTGSGILTVTYTDENGDPIGDPVDLLFYSDIPINLVDTAGGPEPEPITVQIDIKPGSDPNPINPGSNGVIPVAILTTDTFNAADVDPETVTLNGADVAVRGKSDKLMARLEDVDGDGNEDLMLQVDTQSWAELWDGGDVILTGYTYEALGGEEIQGIDSVIIVPPQ